MKNVFILSLLAIVSSATALANPQFVTNVRAPIPTYLAKPQPVKTTAQVQSPASLSSADLSDIISTLTFQAYLYQMQSGLFPESRDVLKAKADTYLAVVGFLQKYKSSASLQQKAPQR